MKITKYIHSCLLVEEGGVAVLLDPGSYTAKEGALNAESPEKLDYILITHEHQDHMHLPLLQELFSKFPQAQVVSNPSVKNILGQEGIAVATEGNAAFEMRLAPHESILGDEPENTLFEVFGRLTHPGDSLRFSETREILALPIQAPWGSMVAAVEKAVMLKPKLVIPIHDWHWRDEARKRFYDMAGVYLKERGVEFSSLPTGAALEV